MRSGADEHLYNPATIHLLQESTKRGDYEMFKEYTALVCAEDSVKNLRGLMDFNYPKKGRATRRGGERGRNRYEI